MKKECEKCGTELNVNPVDCPSVDWVKVVRSNCATVNDIPMIRFSQEVRSE